MRLLIYITGQIRIKKPILLEPNFREIYSTLQSLQLQFPPFQGLICSLKIAKMFDCFISCGKCSHSFHFATLHHEYLLRCIFESVRFSPGLLGSTLLVSFIGSKKTISLQFGLASVFIVLLMVCTSRFA